MNPESELEKKIVNLVGLEKFKSGFDRSKEFFRRYESFFKKREVIIIGGTNGKGETAFYLEHLLRSNGKNTALWTSPHVFKFNERIRIDSVEASVSSLEKNFEVLKTESSLSYYEFMFAMFCEEVIKHERIDYIILEVGLGGRLDTVNVFDCDVAAITSISRDHTEILGETEKEILFEKIPISRKDKPLYSCIEQSFLRSEASEYCKQLKIPYFDLYDNNIVSKEDNYRLRNQILAHTIYEFLTQSDSLVINKLIDIKKSIKPQDFSTLGRFQKMTLQGRTFIFIGAHNLDGIRKLCQYAAVEYTSLANEIDLLISFSDRKESEIKDCLKAIKLSPCFYDKAFITSFIHPRAVKEDKLKSILDTLEFGHFVSPWEEFLKTHDKNKTIMVLGSYYFISSILHSLS